jgi:ABC-type multidrug transport system ATPase subunit
MTSTAVAMTGLTKRYGTRTAVDNLDLELPSGVVAGFVGPNGAGKTTTMAMLLGLVRPTAGTGTVLGASITEPAAYRASLIQGGTAELGIGRAVLTAVLYTGVAAAVTLVLVSRRDVTA